MNLHSTGKRQNQIIKESEDIKSVKGTQIGVMDKCDRAKTQGYGLFM